MKKEKDRKNNLMTRQEDTFIIPQGVMEMALFFNRAIKDYLDMELGEYRNISREIQIRLLEMEEAKKMDPEMREKSGIIIYNREEDPRIRYLERLKKEVETFQSGLNEEFTSIFYLRWIEDNSWEEIGIKLNVSRRMIYRKRDKLLEKYAKTKGMM